MGHEALGELTRDILLRCAGRPVRVGLFDAQYPDRVGRFLGVLSEVCRTELVVECMNVSASVPVGTRATLEVLWERELIWCHTSLFKRHKEYPDRLYLAWPEAIQNSQRRSAPRVDVHLPVHYVVEGEEDVRQGLIEDIGTGGVAMVCPEPLDPGQVLHLVFALGSGLYFQDIQALVLRATPTREGKWLTGIQFTQMSQDQRRLLTSWVARKAGQGR